MITVSRFDEQFDRVEKFSFYIFYLHNACFNTLSTSCLNEIGRDIRYEGEHELVSTELADKICSLT